MGDVAVFCSVLVSLSAAYGSMGLSTNGEWWVGIALSAFIFGAATIGIYSKYRSE